jgi:hypothetical protein
LGELGIVHPPGIERGPRQIDLEIAVHVRRGAPQPDGELVELAEDRAGDEGPVLFELQIGLDANGLPVPQGDLHRVHVIGAVPGGRLDRHLEPARMPGLRQEAPGGVRVGFVELAPLRGKLIDGNRPFLEGGRDGRVRAALALGPGVRFEHLSPVAGSGRFGLPLRVRNRS